LRNTQSTDGDPSTGEEPSTGELGADAERIAAEKMDAVELKNEVSDTGAGVAVLDEHVVKVADICAMDAMAMELKNEVSDTGTGVAVSVEHEVKVADISAMDAVEMKNQVSDTGTGVVVLDENKVKVSEGTGVNSTCEATVPSITPMDLSQLADWSNCDDDELMEGDVMTSTKPIVAGTTPIAFAHDSIPMSQPRGSSGASTLQAPR
jgi:hypothetical protein